jgi:hypothetical protein
LFFEIQKPKRCKHKMKESMNNFIQIFDIYLWQIT